MTLQRAVAGIDVGGDRKGCHLVILCGTRILRNINSRTPEHMLRECIALDVAAVGIDAPCRWGTEDGGRRAERSLAQQGVSSFATPTRERAMSGTSRFYGWMFNGEQVYEAFAASYRLFTGGDNLGERVCFETFPHAVTCAMLGRKIASAKQKRVQRRLILENAGIETKTLKSIDAVDAALCALTAKLLLEGQVHAYGDAIGGYIVVPVSTGQGLRRFGPLPPTPV
jgi:predicted nuclease with RNAse H fold